MISAQGCLERVLHTGAQARFFSTAQIELKGAK
jgi:hypothetical protein